jgi:hypothetical protein
MKTAVVQSSIDCFRGRVQNDKAGLHALILSVMAPGRDYTGQELAKLTGLVPGTISARLVEMREEKSVVRLAERRVCPHSHVSVFVHRKAGRQLEQLA